MKEPDRTSWWREKLNGLSFEEACRTYVLKKRPIQYISVPPVRETAAGETMRWRKALKHFPADDPEREHCCSKEELLEAVRRITGHAGQDAEHLLNRMFAFQPDLIYGKKGILCKPEFLPAFGVFGGTVSIPFETLKEELPEEWYISLQIPDAWIGRLAWSCRRMGSTAYHPCSSRFAEQILNLYRRRRGDFIRKYSFEPLKFFWLEYGSMNFSQEFIRQRVRRLVDAAAGSSC